MRFFLVLSAIAMITLPAACSLLAPFDGTTSSVSTVGDVAHEDDQISERNPDSTNRKPAGAISHGQQVQRDTVALAVAKAEDETISPALSWSWERPEVIDPSPADGLLSVASGDFPGHTAMAMALVKRAGVVGFTGVTFWALFRDCKSFAEGDEASDGAICIIGSISTVIASITHVKEIRDWLIEFGRELKMEAMALAADFTHQALAHIMALGPFLRNQNTKRDAILRRAEDALSAKFQTEVRHIGVWDGAIPGQPKKRGEDAEVYPIFGLNVDGQDFHFAYMGEDDTTNNTRIRLGHGPGINSEENRRRIKTRKTPEFNRQYFDRGGLDALGRSDIAGNNNNPDVQPDPMNNPDDFKWIYNQLGCYFRGGGTLGYSTTFDQLGLWFQIYDRQSQNTLSAGAVAPFSADKPSLITWLKPEGGLLVNNKCLVHDEL